MKDEIKNILKILKKCEWSPCLTKHDATILLDYITNLQKENKILKENAEHNDKVVDRARWNEMIYKSRNEKAIEYCNKEIGNIIAYFDYVDTKDLENVKKILQGEENEK